MTALLYVGIALAGVALGLVALANHWANTPHGRLKPIFALMFRLASLMNAGVGERAIGAENMDTPEQIKKVRSTFSKSTAALSKRIRFPGRIEDRLLPGAPGGELPVRIYRPGASAQAGSSLPLVVFFHGGGFLVGDPDYTDSATRNLALSTPAVVVSVDYRLAPANPFPAAVDDCEFAVNWCFENAASLGARTGPVAVAGDSAGGNLSAVVALRDAAAGRDRIGLQVLIYPLLDATRRDRESHRAFGSGYGLSLKDLDDCIRYYVPSGTDLANADLSPLRAKSFEGLPPAFVITAGFDLLRDEGIEYAETLRAAGIKVRYRNHASMPHGFIAMGRICSEANAMLQEIAAEVRAMA